MTLRRLDRLGNVRLNRDIVEVSVRAPLGPPSRADGVSVFFNGGRAIHDVQTARPAVVAGDGTGHGQDDLLALVTASLEDDKAEDVVVIDLTQKSTMADFMVIASGRSSRQVGAMADHLREKLKDGGHGNAGVEGMARCDWVLIDGGNVIVHIFRPEVRAFYNLEKMWGGPLVEDSGSLHALA